MAGAAVVGVFLAAGAPLLHSSCLGREVLGQELKKALCRDAAVTFPRGLGLGEGGATNFLAAPAVGRDGCCGYWSWSWGQQQGQ